MMACSHQFEDAYTLVGDPVNAVTGASLDTRLEFQMPGPIPFRWVRHYDSSKCGQYYALGWGRTHGYDHRLQFDVDGMRYTAPVGRVVGFPPLTQDGERFAHGGYVLHRVTWRTYRIHHSGEPSMEFDCPDMAVASLARLFRGKDAIQFYYGNGRLQGIVDSRGQRIAATVDDAGRMLALVLEGPDGGRPLIDYYYDPAGNVIESVDPYRNSFKMRYDEHNREIVRTDRLGYSFYFEYDQQARCVHTTGEDGLHDTRLEYHSLEGVTLVTRADGGQWTYLCPGGQLERIIDPYGGSLDFKRDESGRIIEEIDSNGNVTRLQYDANGALAGKVSPLGQAPVRDDPRESPVDPFVLARLMPANEETQPAPKDASVPDCSAEWEFGNLYRRLLSTGDASSTATGSSPHLPVRFFKYILPWKATADQDRWVYDEFGKLIREKGPAGTFRRRVYDANGSLQRLTDCDGSAYNYQHASWNLRVQRIDPLGRAETFSYTNTEKLAAFNDRGGTTSEYDYDLKDQLIRVRRHGVVREEYRYDNSGNLIEKLDGSGKKLLAFEIGPGNVPLARHLDGGQTHSFAYDKQGRIVSAVTAEGEVQAAYDSFGNRIRDQRDGIGITHLHTGPQSLAKTVYFGRFQVQYLRTRHGALTIVDPRGSRHRVESFKPGLMLRTMANGSSELSQFDEEGRCLFRGRHRRASGEVRARQYTYSGEGDLLGIDDTGRSKTQITVDADHRLNRMERPGETHTFAYDAAGNLLQKPGLTASIGDGNRLQAANGDRIEYNARNHIAARKGAAGETKYRYDALDMLIACESPRGTWQAQYDALGRRIAKTGRGRTEFYWDGDRLAAEIREDKSVRLYIYADEFALTPLLFLEYESLDADPAQGTAYYIYSNHLAAPIMVEDESARTVWEAKLDAFGFAQIDAGATLEMPLRFPGHYHDTETGLHYNRYRYYSPELGRYLQSDPSGIRGGANLYAYTANPLRFVDVLGLNDCEDDEEKTNPDIKLPKKRIEPFPPGIPASAIGQGDIVFAVWQNRKPLMPAFVEAAGGKTVNNFKNEKPDKSGPYGGATEYSIAVMNDGTTNHTQMHFDLTGMDTEGALNNTGEYADSTTSAELRNMRDTYDTMDPKPQFWDSGQEVPPPWQSNE
jgi:RHS repeat-associated protein